MRKIIVVVLLFVSSISLTKAEGRQYVGVQVGFTQPISRLNAPNVKDLTTNTYNGMKLGLVYDATIVKGFGYSLSLNYTFAANQTDWKNINSVSTKQDQFEKIYSYNEVMVIKRRKSMKDFEH